MPEGGGQRRAAPRDEASPDPGGAVIHGPSSGASGVVVAEVAVPGAQGLRHPGAGHPQSPTMMAAPMRCGIGGRPCAPGQRWSRGRPHMGTTAVVPVRAGEVPMGEMTGLVATAWGVRTGGGGREGRCGARGWKVHGAGRVVPYRRAVGVETQHKWMSRSTCIGAQTSIVAHATAAVHMFAKATLL